MLGRLYAVLCVFQCFPRFVSWCACRGYNTAIAFTASSPTGPMKTVLLLWMSTFHCPQCMLTDFLWLTHIVKNFLFSFDFSFPLFDYSSHFLSCACTYTLEISPMISLRFIPSPAKYLVLLFRQRWAGDVCRGDSLLPRSFFGIFYLLFSSWAGRFQLYAAISSVQGELLDRGWRLANVNAGQSSINLVWMPHRE